MTPDLRRVNCVQNRDVTMLLEATTFAHNSNYVGGAPLTPLYRGPLCARVTAIFISLCVRVCVTDVGTSATQGKV